MADICAPGGMGAIVPGMLSELKEILHNLPGCEKARMLLYGSRARGDFHEHADIDVAIIVEGLTGPLKRRILDLVADKELQYLTPLSVLVLSKADFELLRERERRIALDIEKEGIPL